MTDNLIDVSSFKKTSRGNVVFGGVTFISYQIGILRYALISEDRRCLVARNYERTTYRASVDQKQIGRRYHTRESAIQAALNVAYGKGK